MPVELKIAISLFIIGVSNLLMRANRNWIFGYRSPRCIKTHKRYAVANGIYGVGTTLISTVYLIIIYFFPHVFAKLDYIGHILIAVVYLAVLFVIIELRLRQDFKDDE